MNDAEAFESLVAEWRAAVASTLADTDRWEHDLRRIESEEGALRVAGHWLHGRADLLGVIERHRDELTHSRMIGWLLDPCGRHGLGTSVLRLLLDYLSIPYSDAAVLGRARVALEVPIDQGRMDIVVDAPGLYLVIENKVDAEEGDGQCQYYADRVTHPSRQFVFLTPSGRPCDAEEFRPVSYRVLTGILQRALNECPTQSTGRDAAAEYLRTLQREFQ